MVLDEGNRQENRRTATVLLSHEVSFLFSIGTAAYVAAAPMLFIAAPDSVCHAKDSSMTGSNVQTKS